MAENLENLNLGVRRTKSLTFFSELHVKKNTKFEGAVSGIRDGSKTPRVAHVFSLVFVDRGLKGTYQIEQDFTVNF